MNEIPQTRQSLLLELARHSEQAWEEFLAIYENALYRFCLAKGLQRADAQDVIQEVLTAVLKRIPTWDPDSTKGSFRGWLFRVARNISVDEIDRRAKKSMATGSSQVANLLSTLPEKVGLNDTSIEIEYQRSLFEWASKQVKSEVREITWLSFCMTAIEGQKAEQVADALGIPLGNVYTAKCRVMARIRDKIAKMNDGIKTKQT